MTTKIKKTLFTLVLIFILAILLTQVNKLKKKSAEINPKIGPIVESIYGLGTVQSDNIYNLKLGVTSRIKKLFVSEGDKVRKGQRLLMFDGEGMQSEFAPFDATVTQINYYSGETVFPQSPVLTLMDLDKRYISVTIDQEGALRVRPKQKTFLSFESLEVNALEGTVRAIFPKQTQMVAHIDSPHLPPEILPGMTADVAIVIQEKQEAILLPLKVIKQGKINLKVNNELVLTPVKLGIVDTDWGEILSPKLNKNDFIEVPNE